MWRYGTKCRYNFMFSLKNLARKGLRCHLISVRIVISYKWLLWDHVFFGMESPILWSQHVPFYKTSRSSHHHWCLNKMVDMLKMTFSNISYLFYSNFCKISFQEFNWQYIKNYGSDNGLALYKQQAIMWTNDDPIHLPSSNIRRTVVGN